MRQVSAAGGAAIQPGAAYSAIFPNNQIPTQCFDPTATALYKNYVQPIGTGLVTVLPESE